LSVYIYFTKNYFLLELMSLVFFFFGLSLEDIGIQSVFLLFFYICIFAQELKLFCSFLLQQKHHINHHYI